MAEEEETIDPNEKIFYTTDELDKTFDKMYKCFCCSYNSSRSGHVVLHIAGAHPQYVHKPRSYNSVSSEKLRCGMKKWSKEELADPNKKLFYTTSNLEKVEGRYKCFCCSHDSPYVSDIIKHITSRHRRFIHESIHRKRSIREKLCLRRGIKTWTEEEVGDPKKKLFYTTSNLEKVEGRYKCFCCSHDAPYASDMVRHITSRHRRFIHESIHRKRSIRDKLCPRRGIKTWTEEEMGDPKKKLFYTTSNLERVEGRYKCFCCSYDSPHASAINKHIKARHRRFIHESIHRKKSIRGKLCLRRGIKTWTEEEVGDPKKGNNFRSHFDENLRASAISTAPIKIKTSGKIKKRKVNCKPTVRTLRNRKAVDYAEHRLTSDSSSDDSSSDGEMMDDDENHILSGDAHSENEALDDANEEGVDEDNNDDDGLNFEDRYNGQQTTEDNAILTPPQDALIGEMNIQEEPEDTSSIHIPVSCGTNEQNMDTDLMTPHEASPVVVDEVRGATKERNSAYGSLKNALKKLDSENERLVYSITAQKAKYKNKISKLKDELRKRNEAVKDDGEDSLVNPHPTTSRFVSDLLGQLDAEKEKAKNMENEMCAKEEEVVNIRTQLNIERMKTEKLDNLFLEKVEQFKEAAAKWDEKMDTLKTKLGKSIMDLVSEREGMKNLEEKMMHITIKYTNLKTTTKNFKNQLKSDSKVLELENIIADKESQLEKVNERVKELEKTGSNSNSANNLFELTNELQLEREKVAAMEHKMASRGVKYSNLKSKIEEMKKQLECQNEKTIGLESEFRQREEELTKKLIDVEGELKRSRKILKLRQKADKLQLEEDLQKQRVERIQKKAQRILEESEIAATNAKKAKEERLREMEKINAELSFIH